MSQIRMITLTPAQVTVVQDALYFYERDFLHQSPYNNLTTLEEASKRKVVARVQTKLGSTEEKE